MKYPLLAGRLYNQPLMIHPDKAQIIERVFRAKSMGQALPLDDAPAPKADAAIDMVGVQQRKDKPYALTDNGVALIPVMGTLVQRGDSIDAMSGLTGYNRLETLLTAALTDREVFGVLLEIDSPGGESAGVFDLAQLIMSARGDKPIWSVANELAASAAYAIAAATEKIFTPRTGMVGSVGVIALHVDQSKRDATQGYAYTAIYAGAHKNDLSSHEPLSAGGRGFMQGMVDRVYGIFTESVASMRGIDVAVVRRTEAAVLDADQALAVKFIDGIASYNEVVATMDAQVARSRSGSFSGMRMAAKHPSNSKESNMSQQQTAADPVAVSYTQAQLDAAVTAASATSRTQERARISSIFGAEEAAGRTAMAQSLALDTDLTVEQARRVLASSPAQAAAQTNALAAAMSNVPNPKVGADASGTADPADEVRAEVAKVLQLVPSLTHPGNRAA